MCSEFDGRPASGLCCTPDSAALRSKLIKCRIKGFLTHGIKNINTCFAALTKNMIMTQSKKGPKSNLSNPSSALQTAVSQVSLESVVYQCQYGDFKDWYQSTRRQHNYKEYSFAFLLIGC